MSEASKAGRSCLFCGSPADSREHVIAEWLSKRMDIREQQFRPALSTSDGKTMMHGPVTPKKFRTRQVCTNCNNGWMSEMEVEFQKHLGFLVEPIWPTFAEEMIVNLRGHSELIVRWMIKTAVVFERSAPPQSSPVVPAGAIQMAKNGTSSKDFFVALGRINYPGFTAHLVKGFPIWNGEVFHPYQQHAEGFSFAVFLNHLAIRLIRCPGASVGVKTHVFTVNGTPVVPFWILPSMKYDLFVCHAYPSFNWFIDAVEIHTGLRATAKTAP